MIKLGHLSRGLLARHILPSLESPSFNLFALQTRLLSSEHKKAYTLVVIGGGAGGISVAARFSRIFKALKGRPNIAVIEPKNVHYYQPLWTLVGAGLKDLPSSARDMASVMPKDVDWIKDSCAEIDPEKNRVRLAGAAGTISYDFLVVAAGLNLDWHKVEGLSEALETPGVCSNYSYKTVPKTFEAIKSLTKTGGNAVFTFPNTPIKCAGAPQKIMYLTDAHLTKNGKRAETTLTYNTALPVIFSSPHYAAVLMELCKERNLNVNMRLDLARIDPAKKTAFFKQLDSPDKPMVEYKYDMLHVTPPMSAPSFLAPLANASSNGFVAVDSKSLQHVKYPNIFSLGDCSSLPTSKTAAAVASQNYILSHNLLALIMKDRLVHKGFEDYDENPKEFSFPEEYDGYTSCPLVTGHNKCILAEFDYSLKPIETFPISQAKERQLWYLVKKDVLPFIYWNMMLKGFWRGPSPFRKLAHLGLSN